MPRNDRRTHRLLLVLVALLGILLALLGTWMVLPAPPEPPPEVALSTPVLDVAPPAPPAPVAAPTASEPPPRPSPRTWRIGGAHMPECWPRSFEPKPLDPARRCEAGDRVELCTVDAPRLRDPIDLDAAHAIIDRIEQVLGLQRQGRLTVLIYESRAFVRARRARGLGPGVVGFFDGHVHVRASVLRGRTLSVLKHELVHAVMGPAIGCAPRSVHEGVADWFEGDTHVDQWVYLLWRGYPYDGRGLDQLLTSEDGYDIMLGYAESAARVHHAARVHGDGVIAEWLARVQTGRLSAKGAAWADLAHATDEPLMHSLAPLLLDEPWSEQLHARLQEVSVTCVSASRASDEVSPADHGADALDERCAMLDRDPADPDLPAPLADAIEHHDERMEILSEAHLEVHNHVYGL